MFLDLMENNMVWLKRLGLGIAAIVTLLIAAIIYIVVFIDPNDFKQELKDVASKQAGITLRLDGDISWSFFPWLGLELADIGVALGEQSELVQFGKAEFGLAILPLLSQTIQVDRVKLIDLKANLVVDKQGVQNWAPTTDKSLDASSSSETSSQNASQNTTAQNNGNSGSTATPLNLPNIQLDQLLVQNAIVQYRDEQNDLLLNTKLNLELNNVRWDEAWPMLLDISLETSDLSGKNKINAEATLGANLSIFPGKEAISLKQITLKTQTEADFLPVSPLQAAISIKQVDLNLPQESVLIDQAQFEGLGVNLSTSINAYQILSAPAFDGTLELAQMNPRDLLTLLSVDLPEMSDATALTSLSAKMTLSGTDKKLQVTPFVLNLDETTLNTTAQVNLAPLYWDVTLKSNALDVDRYLPEPSDEPAVVANEPNSTPPVSGSENDELLPVELLRTLNGRVSVEMENLKVLNLKLDSLAAKSTQSNGLIKLEPLNVNLYSGTAQLSANVDVRKDVPMITVYPDVKKVQIQPLLNDFMELEKIAGTAVVNGNLGLEGNSVHDLMNTLSGDLLVEVKDGALVGMNLTKTVCEGIAATRSEPLSQSAWGADTPFEKLTFPAHIVNGEVSTPGLNITAVGLQVTGDGVISLPESLLNYRTYIAFTGSELDNACRVKETFTELAFPVVCKGHFSDDPAGLCRPDIAGFGQVFANLAKAKLNAKLEAEKVRAKAKLDAEKARAKAKLQAEEDRLQEKLEAEKARAKAKLKEEEERAKEKLEDKLKSSLKGLFG